MWEKAIICPSAPARSCAQLPDFRYGPDTLKAGESCGSAVPRLRSHPLEGTLGQGAPTPITRPTA